MYPNFNAEYARRGLTLEKLAEEMEARGCKRTVSTLSQKLNGKYVMTLYEAKLLRDIVAPEISIDVLFSSEAS
jgi:transcriptional regulator with XRE-family HTH domain